MKTDQKFTNYISTVDLFHTLKVVNTKFNYIHFADKECFCFFFFPFCTRHSNKSIVYEDLAPKRNTIKSLLTFIPHESLICFFLFICFFIRLTGFSEDDMKNRCDEIP